MMNSGRVKILPVNNNKDCLFCHWELTQRSSAGTMYGMTKLAETPEPMNIAQLLREGAGILTPTSSSARLDSELLLGHVLGMTRVGLISGAETPVSADDSQQFHDLILQRSERKPVAQLVGYREFWSLTLTVTDDTLVPRPETELLVERALEHLGSDTTANMLDLGTGTGAIALAIAVERPQMRITATDISLDALSTARQNAATLGIECVEFIEGDWFSATGEQVFNIIVSNPPYVSDDEWKETDPELGYEPVLALRAGTDGLDAIRVIVACAPSSLEPDGWLLIEHGFRQGTRVRQLFEQAGFRNVVTHNDLADHPRVTEGFLKTPVNKN